MADTGQWTTKEALLHQIRELGIKSHTLEHREVFTVEQALPHFADLPNAVFAKNLFLRDKKKKLWLYCAPHSREVKLNELAKHVGAPGGFRFADEAVLLGTLGVQQGAVTIFALINDVQHKVQLILDQSFWEEEVDDTQGSFTPIEKDIRSRTSACEDSAKSCFTCDALKKPVEDDCIVNASVCAVHVSDTEDNATALHSTENVFCEKLVYFHPLVNSASTGITVKGLRKFVNFTGHKPIVYRL